MGENPFLRTDLQPVIILRFCRQFLFVSYYIIFGVIVYPGMIQRSMIGYEIQNQPKIVVMKTLAKPRKSFVG